MKVFAVKVLVISVIVALTGWLVFSRILPGYYLPVLPFLLLFVVLITLTVHAYQLRLAKKDIARFARSNMLITFFKLLVYSAAAVIYIAIHKDQAVTFVIILMVLYFIYTLLEVVEITKITRKNKE